MEALSLRSESLMASLCKEIDAVRTRARRVSQDRERTTNSRLRQRLDQEWERLHARRVELLRVAQRWKPWASDKLATEFLVEVCSRPLAGYTFMGSREACR